MNKKILISVLVAIIVVQGLFLVSNTFAGVVNNGDGTVTLSYTMSTENALKLQEAICYEFNYQDMILGDNETITNPQSCQEFGQEIIKGYFNKIVNNYERDLAKAQAIKTDLDIN